MKFIIKRDILLENLINVSKAISSRNLIPILSGIKFDLKEDGLYLYASDSNISIRCLISEKDITKIEGLGSIVIGGRYIVEIIRKLPSTDITIEVLDGYNMIISTSNTEFNLNGINPNEFPNLDIEETREPIIFEAGILKNIINQTLFATSQSESRPLLTGINIKINKETFEVIATDSYRLAKKNISISEIKENEINIVIPGKNLLELTKIIEDDQEKIEMHVFSNKILFKYKKVLFLSRLLNGTYPATSAIIPTEFKMEVECNFFDLFNMIDRASLLTSDREKNTIRLELTGKDLIISSNSPEIGKVEEKIALVTKEKIIISFSSKYMLDAIKSFNQENIILCMNNDSSPIVVKSKKDDSLIQLVLPIKTY